MKRRITIAIVIFILLISVSVSSYYLINHRLDRISEAINSAYLKMSENTLPENECSILKIEWQKSRQILYIFLNHREVVELEDNIESIEKCLTEELKTNLKILIIQTVNQVNDLKKSTSITIENIL